MSSTTVTAPLTARTFLLGAEEAERAVGRSLSDLGVARSALEGLHHLSDSALKSVDREIGVVVGGLLDVDLEEALLSGWRRYDALRQAAKRTLAAPGSEEVLALATHRVTSTYHPEVDLFVDDVTVKTLEFELNIVFDITGVSAVVRLGDLVALRGGDCLVTATLALQGERLAERQGHVDLALLVQLDPPVPLVDTTAVES